MKKYFQLRLRGRDFLAPVAAVLLSVVVLCEGLVLAGGVVNYTDGGAMVADGGWLLYLLLCGVIQSPFTPNVTQ